jgi:hypothetical protein
MTIVSTNETQAESTKGATAMHNDAIGDFLKAVEAATIDETDVYADDVVLDATVPNWRLHFVGQQAVKAEYAK